MQRYRLIWEFALDCPKDYHAIKAHLEDILTRVAARPIGLAPDYLAIEKIKEEPK